MLFLSSSHYLNNDKLQSGGLDGDNDLVDGSSRVVNSSTSSGSEHFFSSLRIPRQLTIGCLPIIIPIGATLSYSTPPNLGIYNGGTIVSLNCPGSTPIGLIFSYISYI